MSRPSALRASIPCIALLVSACATQEVSSQALTAPIPIFSKDCELEVRPKSQMQTGTAYHDTLFWSEVSPAPGELVAAELRIFVSAKDQDVVYLSDAPNKQAVSLDTTAANVVRIAYTDSANPRLKVTVIVGGKNYVLPVSGGRPDVNVPFLPPDYRYTRRHVGNQPKIRQLVIHAWDTTFSLWLMA